MDGRGRIPPQSSDPPGENSDLEGTDLEGSCSSREGNSDGEEPDRAWNKVGDPDDLTTDGEPELGGRRRPKRGDGWWGVGPGFRTRRKGLYRDACAARPRKLLRTPRTQRRTQRTPQP